jgi:tRNA(fMet)-specific endonuclease VapC
MANVETTRLFLSALTIGEIKRGIVRLPASKRRSTLESWLEQDLSLRFHGRILPLDMPVMLTWGQLVGELEGKGRPLPAIDSLIAATALHYQLRLVTRNEKDFANTGVNVLNPWREGS